MIVMGYTPAETFADRPFDTSNLGPIASETDRQARRYGGYSETVRAREVRYLTQVVPEPAPQATEETYAEILAEALAEALTIRTEPPAPRKPAPRNRSEDSAYAKLLTRRFHGAVWQGTNGIRAWALNSGWAEANGYTSADLPARAIVRDALDAWCDAHEHLRRAQPFAGEDRGTRDRHRGATV